MPQAPAASRFLAAVGLAVCFQATGHTAASLFSHSEDCCPQRGLVPSRSRSQSLGSFRPGSKVNQARPGTQDIHLPRGVVFHRLVRSPDFAAVQLALHPGSGPREAETKPPGPRAPPCCCRDGGGGGVTARLLLSPPPPVSDSPPCPPGHHSDFRPGSGPQYASKLKFPPAGGPRGPGPPPRPQRGTASRPGGQGGLPVLRAALVPRAPARHRSPRALLHDRRGGARRRPSGRDPPSGRASALTGLLAAPQPAAVDFVGDPKPTSGLPGASRSGRHLELLFTGAAGSPYEGELLAFHRFAPTDFSTGPRDTGAPCTTFFRSLGPRWLKADDGGVQSTLRVRPPS
ncbi:hypothetical protein NDU88_010708 [Pleurodeles waltl]|uniref:Uncharacterized protein n=1 Tax=Pleurodeles waltl TaxID=8319 RepID=A0AAV7QZK3_PLEWA|nr:hypothetical protein NDU88_010708 [Pleurodeles waltl]